MGRAYLMGHGSHTSGNGEAYLPKGYTISFFADLGKNVLQANGVAAISNGDLKPTQTYTGPCQVPNYHHSALGDREMVHMLSAAKVDGTLYFVGDGVVANGSSLCNTPEVCSKTDATRSAVSAAALVLSRGEALDGVAKDHKVTVERLEKWVALADVEEHDVDCGGVLAVIQEKEIYSLACRGSGGGMGGTGKVNVDRKLEGSTEYANAVQDEHIRLKNMLTSTKKDDRDRAIKNWLSLPPERQAALNSLYTYPNGKKLVDFVEARDGGASVDKALAERNGLVVKAAGLKRISGLAKEKAILDAEKELDTAEVRLHVAQQASPAGGEAVVEAQGNVDEARAKLNAARAALPDGGKALVEAESKVAAAQLKVDEARKTQEKSNPLLYGKTLKELNDTPQGGRQLASRSLITRLTAAMKIRAVHKYNLKIDRES